VIRSSSRSGSRCQRAACALAALAVGALCGGGTSAQALDAHAAVAQAGVVFGVPAMAVTVPKPGVILVSNLPTRIRSGHTFTFHELLPFAVVPYGNVQFQRRLASGAWQTLALTRVTPRVFWVHWKVPSQLKGTTLSVRFVLRSDVRQFLASSPAYTVSVT
jgi:hypothetical protein